MEGRSPWEFDVLYQPIMHSVSLPILIFLKHFILSSFIDSMCELNNGNSWIQLTLGESGVHSLIIIEFSVIGIEGRREGGEGEKEKKPTGRLNSTSTFGPPWFAPFSFVLSYSLPASPFYWALCVWWLAGFFLFSFIFKWVMIALQCCVTFLLHNSVNQLWVYKNLSLPLEASF